MGDSYDDVALYGDMAEYYLGLDDEFVDGFGLELDDEDCDGPAQSSAECRHCGEEDLVWDQTVNGWRLFVVFANGRKEQHRCKRRAW